MATHPSPLARGRLRAGLCAIGVMSITTAACDLGPTRGAQARLAAATPDSDVDRPGEPRHAKLKFEIHGRAFPLPLVTGTIAGHPVLMLVDTGANSHVIAGWQARKLGLAMKKLGDVGTDHVGKTIATFRVERPQLAVDGWGTLDPSPVLATDVPDVIEKLGIGAFISPQRLVEQGDSVLLDLAKAEIHTAHWDDAQAELRASGTPLVVGEARVCEENEGPIKGLAFVVPAVVGSHRVELLVDTGAQHSDVFTTSLAGQRLGPQSVVNKDPMYTASGKVSARKIPSTRVSAGEVSVTTDVDLIAGTSDASCPRDGVLAMDVLRTCRLLLGRNRIVGSCAK